MATLHRIDALYAALILLRQSTLHFMRMMAPMISHAYSLLYSPTREFKKVKSPVLWKACLFWGVAACSADHTPPPISDPLEPKTHQSQTQPTPKPSSPALQIPSEHSPTAPYFPSTADTVTSKVLQMNCDFALNKLNRVLQKYPFYRKRAQEFSSSPSEFANHLVTRWSASVDPTHIFLSQQDREHLSHILTQDPDHKGNPSTETLDFLPLRYCAFTAAGSQLLRKRILEVQNHYQQLLENQGDVLSTWSIATSSSFSAASLLTSPSSLRPSNLDQRIEEEFRMLSAARHTMFSSPEDLKQHRFTPRFFLQSKIKALQKKHNHRQKPNNIYTTFIENFLQVLGPHSSYKLGSTTTAGLRHSRYLHLAQGDHGLAQVMHLPRCTLFADHVLRPGDTLLAMLPSPAAQPTSLVDLPLDQIQQHVLHKSNRDALLQVLRAKDDGTFTLLTLPLNSPLYSPHPVESEIIVGDHHDDEQKEEEELIVAFELNDDTHDAEEEEEHGAHRGIIPLLMIQVEELQPIQLADPSSQVPSSSQDILQALQHFISSTSFAFPRAVVLDLRGSATHPDLTYMEVLRILSLFLPTSTLDSQLKLINYAQQRSHPLPLPTTYPAWLGPLVVLMDRCSSYPAELIAASLQAHQRALLLGESPQNFMPRQSSYAPLHRPNDILSLATGLVYRAGFHLQKPSLLAAHIDIPVPTNNCHKSSPHPSSLPYFTHAPQTMPTPQNQSKDSVALSAPLLFWLKQRHHQRQKEQAEEPPQKTTAIQPLSRSKVTDFLYHPPNTQAEYVPFHNHEKDVMRLSAIDIAKDYSVYLHGLNVFASSPQPEAR